jgi:hypothetical protein
MELVAVQGCTIIHSTGSPITGGVFTITTAPSAKYKAQTKGIYRGVIAFTFAGGSASGCVPGSVTGTGTISPTSTKHKVDALFVIREGDTGAMAAAGTNDDPPPSNLTFPSCPVEISVAGQVKLSSN